MAFPESEEVGEEVRATRKEVGLDTVGTGDLDFDGNILVLFSEELEDIISDGKEGDPRIVATDMKEKAMLFDIHPKENEGGRGGTRTGEKDTSLPVGKGGELFRFQETGHDSAEKAQEKIGKLINSANFDGTRRRGGRRGGKGRRGGGGKGGEGERGGVRGRSGGSRIGSGSGSGNESARGGEGGRARPRARARRGGRA